jgi:hypothetical protein
MIEEIKTEVTELTEYTVTHSFYIAGVKFHKMHEVEDILQEGTILTLEPEPTNEYDPNAVKILYAEHPEEQPIMLGYVPMKISSEIVAKLEAGRSLQCIITEFDINKKPWERCRVEIRQFED